MSTLLSLPEDLIQRILTNIETKALLKLCNDSSTIRRLADASHVWSDKMLAISDFDEADQLSRNKHLLRHIQHIDLSQSDVSMEKMTEALDCCEKIQTLHLRCVSCTISDDFVDKITRKHGRTLKTLSFDRGYELTNLSIEMIQENCSKLANLSIYGCMISSAAIMHLSQSPLAKTLRLLDLGRCHLIDFNKIRKDLESFTQLRSLSLSYNDSVNPAWLADLVANLPHLHTLDITDCVEICKKDVRQLEKIRPGIRVVHSAKLDDYTPASIRSYLLSLHLIVSAE